MFGSKSYNVLCISKFPVNHILFNLYKFLILIILLINTFVSLDCDSKKLLPLKDDESCILFVLTTNLYELSNIHKFNASKTNCFILPFSPPCSSICPCLKYIIINNNNNNNKI